MPDTNQHPATLATPPDELVQQWHSAWYEFPRPRPSFDKWMTIQASQWGWNQRNATVPAELQQAVHEEREACSQWLADRGDRYSSAKLLEARRPKPPVTAEQALKTLRSMQINPVVINGITVNADLMAEYDTIRAALERLQHLEQLND